MLEQPDAAIVHRLGVAGHLIKGLNHECLRLNRRAIPPPAQFRIAPEPPQFLVRHTALLEGFHNGERRGVVERIEGVETLQREGEMGLRLAIVRCQPVFACLPEEKVHGFKVRRGHRQILEEKAASIEVQRVRRAGNIIPGLRHILLNTVVVFAHPVVQVRQGTERRGQVHIRVEVPQAAETRDDVQGDVIVAVAAGKPGPASVLELHLGQLLEQGRRLVVQPVGVEQDAHVAARLAFILRLPPPGRLLDQHGFEVLVFLQGRIQGGGIFPEVKHAADFGVAIRQMAGERVGIEPVKRLLAALVRKLHEIRQRQHRIPRRLRHHLHGQARVLQRRGAAGIEQLGKLKMLHRLAATRLAANRQRQRFGYIDAP